MDVLVFLLGNGQTGSSAPTPELNCNCRGGRPCPPLTNKEYPNKSSLQNYNLNFFKIYYIIPL